MSEQPQGTPAQLLSRVSAAADGSVWGIDKNGAVLQYMSESQTWRTLPNAPQLVQLSAGSAKDIWGVDKAGRILRSSGDEQAWQPVAGTLTQVSVAADGTVWGVNSAGTIFRFVGGSQLWQPVPGQLSQVAVGSATNVWGVNKARNIYRYVGGDAVWEQVPGQLSQVVVGGDGSVCGISRLGHVCAYTEPPNYWFETAATVHDLSVGDSANAWAILPDGSVINLVGFAGGEGHHGASVGNHLLRWDAEDVFDDKQSTHLWIVNRAATLAQQDPDVGKMIYDLVQPGKGRIGDDGFHDNFCQGLYDADWKAPYNDPVVYGLDSYKSHFYDPADGTNWMGEDDPTALTRGREFFRQARAAYRNGDLKKAGYNLGLSLHYLTDLTQPMHAANFTWLSSVVWGYHTGFESYALAIQGDAKVPDRYEPSTLGLLPDDYLKAAAWKSKEYIGSICQPLWTLNYKTIPDQVWQDAVRPVVLEQLLPNAIRIASQYLVAWMKSATQSATGPRLRVFHRGYNDSQEVWCSAYTDPTWELDQLTNAFVASTSLSAVTFNGQLYCFMQAGGQLSMSKIGKSGLAFSNTIVPRTGASESPSAVVFNNRLYCFHQGHGESGELWYNTFDGTNWSGDVKVPGTGMSASPSAVVFNNRLYCFHQGYAKNGELWYNTFDGRNWSGDVHVPGTGTSEGPSAVVYNGRIYCFHQGYAENGELWYNAFDGANWTGDTRVQRTLMSANPSAVVYKDRLYCFHQGYERNGQLWYNTFDGRNWAGDQRMYGVGISASPAATVAEF